MTLHLHYAPLNYANFSGIKIEERRPKVFPRGLGAAWETLYDYYPSIELNTSNNTPQCGAIVGCV